MVAVALCLATLICVLRRKHKRNQALRAAEREARLEALREAEALEAARLAELGLEPFKPPVVVVQPNGEATLAAQLAAPGSVVVMATPAAAPLDGTPLGSGSAAWHAAAAGHCAAGAAASSHAAAAAQCAEGAAGAPGLHQHAWLQPQHAPPPQPQAQHSSQYSPQMLEMQRQLALQQQAFVAQARASAAQAAQAGQAPPPLSITQEAPRQ